MADMEEQNDFFETTKVLVGEKETAFVVHTAIICRQSAFFRAALKGTGDWLEKRDNEIKLPDDDPKTFCRFLQWLYRDILPMDELEDVENGSQPASQPSMDITGLIELYMFAKRTQTPTCMKDVITRIYCERDNIYDIPITPCRDLSDYREYTNYPRCDDALWEFIEDWHVLKLSRDIFSRYAILEIVTKVPELASGIIAKFADLAGRELSQRKLYDLHGLKYYLDFANQPVKEQCTMP